MRLSNNVKEQLASEGKSQEEQALRAVFQGRVPAIFFMLAHEGDDQEVFVIRTSETTPTQREPVCMLDVVSEIELNRATQYLADSLGQSVYGVRFIALDVASVAYPKTEKPEA